MSFLNPVNKAYCLEQLCESNYQKLFNLIPHLLSVQDHAVGFAEQHVDLYLDVIEHTPYTRTIKLTHCFYSDSEPAVLIRVYVDARLAEVLSDSARLSVNTVFDDPGLTKEILQYKWRLNLFLQKWLDHCLKSKYQFNRVPSFDKVMG